MSSAILSFPQAYLDKKKDEFKAKYKERPNGCHIWTGAVSGKRGYYEGGSRYGAVKWTHPVSKDKIVLNAHVVSFYFSSGLLPCNVNHVDISHRCHDTLCVNPEHLSREPHRVNLDRRKCRRVKSCHSHGDHPPCLFAE